MAGLCRNIGGCIRCLGRAYRCLSQGGEESIESPRCRSSPSSSAGAAEVARSCGPTAGLCQCRCTIWCPCPGRLVGGRRVGGRGRAWTPVGAFEAPCVEDADRHQARLLAPRGWRAMCECGGTPRPRMRAMGRGASRDESRVEAGVSRGGSLVWRESRMYMKKVSHTNFWLY